MPMTTPSCIALQLYFQKLISYYHLFPAPKNGAARPAVPTAKTLVSAVLGTREKTNRDNRVKTILLLILLFPLGEIAICKGYGHLSSFHSINRYTKVDY
jgi:hypothetical protein